MHIAPLENNNKPIVDVNDSKVPLNYFNIINLKTDFRIPSYEKLNFSSIVKKNKVIAFQFYSGKSGNSGVILLKNAVKNILQ